jgi:hypothetical protein
MALALLMNGECYFIMAYEVISMRRKNESDLIPPYRRRCRADRRVSTRRQNEPVLTPLCGEILRYLQAYPEAADTVDGIVEWWLPRQRYEDAVHRVQDVLHQLVARELVEKITLVDGTVLYARIRRKKP